MFRVNVTVGRGGWTFNRTIHLPCCPILGQGIGPSGDLEYTVSHVCITPAVVYVRCDEPFESDVSAQDAGVNWDVEAGITDENMR